MTVSALVLLSIAGLAPAASAVGVAQVPSGTTCTDETVRWGGSQVLDAATPSFDTGVDVVARAGTTLTVVGVSADGLDASERAQALPVFVGGTAALPTASVSGGDVVVRSDGTQPLRVFSVTVVVRRCAEVAVASSGAAQGTPVADATVASQTAPSTAQAAAVVAALPETGRGAWRETVLGALMIAVGAAFVSFGRRRSSALG